MKNEYWNDDPGFVCSVCSIAVYRLTDLCKHCDFLYCDSDFFSVLGSDHVYYHAENEQRRGKLFPVGDSVVYSGRKYYEQRGNRETSG